MIIVFGVYVGVPLLLGDYHMNMLHLGCWPAIVLKALQLDYEYWRTMMKPQQQGFSFRILGVGGGLTERFRVCGLGC